MEKYVFSILAVFQVAVFLIMLYYLGIGVMAFFVDENKKAKNFKPKNKFALLVAAHNEEVVIANLINSLNSLNYPKHLYDVFVIADNCTDKTAEIAGELGAKVYERFNKDKRGKGYALEWMFEKIFKMKEEYDAIAIFDADNLVDKNFLKEINNKMCEGYSVVQGCIDTKNPKDSWVTESCDLSLSCTTRKLQLARDNVSLSAQLGGTGFIIATKILKKLGWGATCLTEDLEFTCKLVLNDELVAVADRAVIYDEKPLTLKDSWVQRKRWMQGFADVASRYAFKLFEKAIKEKDRVAFDCAMYVIQPFMSVLFGIAVALSVFEIIFVDSLNRFFTEYLFSDGLWKIFCIFQIGFVIYNIAKEKKISYKIITMLVLFLLNIAIQPIIVSQFRLAKDPTVLTLFNFVYTVVMLLATVWASGKDGFKTIYNYIISGIYVVTWIPITIQGIIDKDKKEWSHTKHVRQLEIYEM